MTLLSARHPVNDLNSHTWHKLVPVVIANFSWILKLKILHEDSTHSSDCDYMSVNPPHFKDSGYSHLGKNSAGASLLESELESEGIMSFVARVSSLDIKFWSFLSDAMINMEAMTMTAVAPKAMTMATICQRRGEIWLPCLFSLSGRKLISEVESLSVLSTAV